MTRTYRIVTTGIVVCLLASFVGCGESKDERGKKDGSARHLDLERMRDEKKFAGEKKEEKKEEKKGEKKEQNAEAYARIVENPFLRADKTPLSTFSVDVDTASYSNVRRFLTQEQRLPPANAVRVEELINYFPYDYLPAKENDPVAFTLEIATCPWNAKHYLARIGLAARKLEPGKMPARNLVFLVDTSGSMNPENRLPLLKTSLKMLVEQLTSKDRVALVAYAGRAGLVLDSTPGDQKKKINDAIDRLSSGGSTAGGAGIELAYRVATENFLQGGVNRVILGTDGDFNVGIRDESELVSLIEKKRKSGVYLTVLGFGMGNLKNANLEALAQHGNGHYAYVDSEREARKVFVEQGGSLVTVAKDVKLQIVFDPKRVGAYRLIGYENRLLRDEDFKDDTKDAGDMGSGHTVTAFYEIIPPGEPIPEPGVEEAKFQKTPKQESADSDLWLTVKLRYKDPEAEKSKELVQPLGGPALKLADTSADFRFASAVASFGMLLRDSSYRGDATFARVRKQASAARGNDPGKHREGFLELVDAAEKLKGAK